jgi:hypothetical protein
VFVRNGARQLAHQYTPATIKAESRARKREREQTERPRKTAEPAAAAGKCDGAGRAASAAAGAPGAAQEEARRAAGALPAAHPHHRPPPRGARCAAIHAAHRRRNGLGHVVGDATRCWSVARLLGVDGPLHPRSGELQAFFF